MGIRRKEGLTMDPIQKYFILTDDQFNRLTRQHKSILAMIIIKGSITPMDAFSELYITKLATRISEMKKIGIRFDQIYESRTNSLGRKSHYMRYRKAA